MTSSSFGGNLWETTYCADQTTEVGEAGLCSRSRTGGKSPDFTGGAEPLKAGVQDHPGIYTSPLLPSRPVQ